MQHIIYTGVPSDDPHSDISSASDALHALAMLVGAAKSYGLESDKAAQGFAVILDVIASSLNSSAEAVSKMINEPRSQGYREGMNFASDEYRRGFGEGQSATLRTIAELNPEAAAIAAEAVDQTPLERAQEEVGKLDNEPDPHGGDESYPVVNGKPPVKEQAKDNKKKTARTSKVA